MKFPNAYKGVKKLYIAEILALVAAVLSIVAAIMTALLNANPDLPLKGAIIGIGFGVLALALVCFILQIVGLYQAGKDEGSFRLAFFIVIFNIVLTLVSSIIGSINSGAAIASNVMQMISDIASVVVIFFILSGLGVLANRLGDERMERNATRLMWFVIILLAASLLLQFIPRFIPNPTQPVAVTFAILAIVAGVAELVAYICIFIFYGRSVKMLEK